MNCYKGMWKKRIAGNGETLVVFRDFSMDRESIYIKPSILEKALANVKRQRSSYATQKSYDAMIEHFERGLCLF